MRARSLFVAFALVTLVAACGNDTASGSANSAPANQATTIQMTEYRFIPADAHVPLNSTLTLVDIGKMAHSYVLRGAGVGTGEVQPGKSRKLILQGVAAGTYQVFCDLPGHEAAGEVGTLTISP